MYISKYVFLLTENTGSRKEGGFIRPKEIWKFALVVLHDFFEMSPSDDPGRVDLYFNDVCLCLQRILGSSLRFIFRVCTMLFLYMWFFHLVLTHNFSPWPQSWRSHRSARLCESQQESRTRITMLVLILSIGSRPQHGEQNSTQRTKDLEWLQRAKKIKDLEGRAG